MVNKLNRNPWKEIVVGLTVLIAGCAKNIDTVKNDTRKAVAETMADAPGSTDNRLERPPEPLGFSEEDLQAAETYFSENLNETLSRLLSPARITPIHGKLAEVSLAAKGSIMRVTLECYEREPIPGEEEEDIYRIALLYKWHPETGEPEFYSVSPWDAIGVLKRKQSEMHNLAEDLGTPWMEAAVTER